MLGGELSNYPTSVMCVPISKEAYQVLNPPNIDWIDIGHHERYYLITKPNMVEYRGCRAVTTYHLPLLPVGLVVSEEKF
jgi:hypothetical protein